jgi:hypothetical protein
MIIRFLRLTFNLVRDIGPGALQELVVGVLDQNDQTTFNAIIEMALDMTPDEQDEFLLRLDYQLNN